MLCWGIWKARNEVVWQQKKPQVNSVCCLTMQYFEQWRKTQVESNIALFPNRFERDGASHWVRPQVDTIKVSVDTAIFEKYFASGFGMVARNSEGELVYAKTRRLWGLLSPKMAEAMAIKEALSLSKTQTRGMIEIESDCLGIIQAIRSKVIMASLVGSVIEECRVLFEELNNVSLFFIKWSANMAAHCLARASYSLPDRVFNRSVVPVEVQNYLLNDLSMK